MDGRGELYEVCLLRTAQPPPPPPSGTNCIYLPPPPLDGGIPIQEPFEGLGPENRGNLEINSDMQIP